MNQLLENELKEFQGGLKKLRTAATLLNDAKKSVENSAELSQKLIDDHQRLSSLLNSFVNKKLESIEASGSTFLDKIDRLTTEKLGAIQRSEVNFSSKVDRFVNKKLEAIEQSEEGFRKEIRSLQEELNTIQKEVVANKQVGVTVASQVENILAQLTSLENSFSEELNKVSVLLQKQSSNQHADLQQASKSIFDLVSIKSRVQTLLIGGLYLGIAIIIYLLIRRLPNSY